MKELITPALIQKVGMRAQSVIELMKMTSKSNHVSPVFDEIQNDLEEQ
jgi:hypothetical protein